MYENGVHGRYSEWLRAVNAGDEQRARDKERYSAIGFECDLINEEEASTWKIKAREEPDADSKQLKRDDEIIAELEKRIAEAKARQKEKQEKAEKNRFVH